MRRLEVIAVFTPEPWQRDGYGDQTDALIAAASTSPRSAWRCW
jgi:hypothetical protein